MHILSLAVEIREEINKNNDNYYLLAIDLKKAFDSVNHAKLIELLEEKNFPTQIIDILKLMLESMKTSINLFHLIYISLGLG